MLGTMCGSGRMDYGGFFFLLILISCPFSFFFFFSSFSYSCRPLFPRVCLLFLLVNTWAL